MTSSIRNSIHRRNHKERSQLSHRAKFGILEKHKDYVKRARDYHSKQDRLTRLKQKAAEKNNDEFYFSMNKEKTKNGVHIKERGNIALPTDIVKVLKTQDENYVRTMRTSNIKKIDKLKRQIMEMADLMESTANGNGSAAENKLQEEEYKILQEAGIFSHHLSGKKTGRRKPQHIWFAGSVEEAQSLGQKSSSDIETKSGLLPNIPVSQEDLGWKAPDLKKKPKQKPLTVEPEEADDLSLPLDSSDKRKGLLKELSARLFRDRQLRYTQREFEMQRLMMGKGARKKIAGVEKVEGGRDHDEEDEDEIDARKGRRRDTTHQVNELTYKPRVYKWKLERKR